MKMTFIGTDVAKSFAVDAHHQAMLREIQLRRTKFLKSGLFHFSLLHVFMRASQAMFLGVGLFSGFSVSVNSTTKRPTVLISNMKKFSARIALDRAVCLSPRTPFHFVDISSNASVTRRLSVDSCWSSSEVKRPSAAQSVQHIRHSVTACTTFSRGSFISLMTSLWLSSNPSRKTAICITASRRSKSFSIFRWLCIRFRTTPAEPQSKNSHQAPFKSVSSLSMSSRFLSSCELYTLILSVLHSPQ
mmetsp:Transcript_50670/g.151586  ORF Transcript_50670/g.151586 Transcript_50670/m.151586 type:complete len:245 (+) Transcript_50670:1430-2164(+)